MKTIYSLLCLALLSACKTEGPGRFTVKGSFTGAPGATIMLAELPFAQPQRVILDSAILDSAGLFSLHAIQQQEGMYQLFIKNGPGILLINDSDSILVHANVDSLSKYQVAYSPASLSLKRLFEQFTVLEDRAEPARILVDSIKKTKTPDSLKTPFVKELERRNLAVNDFLKAYAGLEKNATAEWYALGLTSRFLNETEWALLLEKALSKHPNHVGLLIMKNGLDAAIEARESGQALLNKPLPDVTLTDTTGKPISVSAFRGRWLLIDFWVSSSVPSRQYNIDHAAFKNEFADKRFSMLGVSLDQDTLTWKNTIRQDSLTWPQVSDLQEWNSKAIKTYGFKKIPFNILLDTAGTVVAVNLYGDSLHQKLQAVLKK